VEIIESVREKTFFPERCSYLVIAKKKRVSQSDNIYRLEGDFRMIGTRIGSIRSRAGRESDMMA